MVCHCGHGDIGKEEDSPSVGCISAIEVAVFDFELHDCMLIVQLFEDDTCFVGIDVMFVDIFEGHDFVVLWVLIYTKVVFLR